MRRSVAAKTAQLERRLDELTTLLSSQAVQSNTASNPTPAAPDAPLSDSGFSSASQAPGCSPPCIQAYAGDVPQLGPAHPVAGDNSYATDDQQILDEFCANRLPYLPFIYIPPLTPVEKIKRESPFLWRSMVTLHCKDTVRRMALHTEFKTAAANALLVECHRSFDLLQSLLVYLAWYILRSSWLSPLLTRPGSGLNASRARFPSARTCRWSLAWSWT